MQDKKMKTEIVLLPCLPKCFSKRDLEAILCEMYVDGRKLIIENLDDVGDIVCEGDCEDCPVDQTDCDGE